MDDLLWVRVLVSFLADGSFAVLCGLLLSTLWLRSGHSAFALSEEVRLGTFGLLLFLTLCVQLLLLTVSFSGQTSLHAVMISMPDVCSTHAGEIDLALCGVAAMLCFATLIPSQRYRMGICTLLVFLCLCLRASSGHASSNGDFSLAELLQVIHLLGMAAWSGGVIVSGLLVAPQFYGELLGGQAWHSSDSALAQTRPIDSLAAYLGKLSLVSTWAVGVVLLSGLLKAYVATEDSLKVVRTSPWGQILTVKAAFVTVAVLLGARNRWLLTSTAQENSSSGRSSVRTLRLEAICMLAVLLLSAWLANSQPPME